MPTGFCMVLEISPVRKKAGFDEPYLEGRGEKVRCGLSMRNYTNIPRKCPECGSVLVKKPQGKYFCPNYKGCKVIFIKLAWAGAKKPTRIVYASAL